MGNYKPLGDRFMSDFFFFLFLCTFLFSTSCVMCAIKKSGFQTN